MFIKTFPKHLLQIFSKITVNLKVIAKSIIEPDDNQRVKHVSAQVVAYTVLLLLPNILQMGKFCIALY